MKRFYLLTALFALTAAGCVKVDLVDVSTSPLPENLTVEQTDYTLGPIEERTATVVFSAKGDWTLSIVYDDADAGDETDADAAWLTTDAAGGAAGEQSLGMSAARNFQAAPRTAYVDLVCGEQTVRLTSPRRACPTTWTSPHCSMKPLRRSCSNGILSPMRRRSRCRRYKAWP